MSYYSDLKNRNVADWIKPLTDKGVYKSRLSDGKFELGELAVPVESPWHYINFVEGANCVYLHSHLFDSISPRTPIGKFIPRRCQQCWKIVIRPNNLKQLFALEKFLLTLGWPCKCGIERRAYAPLSRNRYGGYIYNVSLEEGLGRLKFIREKLNEIPALSDVKCYLKRACTEMELEFPDSTSWKVTDEQNRIEDLLDWYVVSNVPTTAAPKHLLDHIHIKWIEWAAEIGDETYLEYTGGNRLYQDCVKYEPVAEGTDEVTPNGEIVGVSPSSGEVPKGSARRKTRKKVKK